MADNIGKVVHTVGHTAVIPEHLKPFVDFLGDFNSESERGAVLSAAAYIDDLLGKTIAAFLVEGANAKDLVGEYPGALSGFSARIMAAHALGLISDDERSECTAIRKVRNEFAHAVKMSFDDAKVKGLCSGLKLAIKPPQGANARMQFQTASVSLILHLTNRPVHVGKSRLKYQEWPY